MLNFFRKNTKPIIWTVVVAFVTWGGYAVGLQLTESNRAAGRLFGKEISFREYQSASEIIQTFYVPEKGQAPPSAEEVEGQVWQFLMLVHEAERRKIAVTDDELRQEISRLLGNTGTWEIDRDTYFRWIRAQFRREPKEFEDQVRENLRVRKLLEEVRKGFQEKPEEQMKTWLANLVRQAQPKAYRTLN